MFLPLNIKLKMIFIIIYHLETCSTCIINKYFIQGGFALMIQIGKVLGGVGVVGGCCWWVTYQLPLSSSLGLDQKLNTL